MSRRSLAGCAALLFAACANAPAQDPPKEVEKVIDVIVTKDGIDAAQIEQLTFPEPEGVSITTPDGFTLSATFYGGILGKKTPVLILLHDLGGSAGELNELARWLQTNFGFASIVPDLRGHGNSPLPNAPELEPDKFSGAQLTNILAAEWSLVDWSFPRLAGKKQGQDVKQLVMISPVDSYKGVRMTAIKEPLFTGREFETPLNVWLVYASTDKQQKKDVEMIQDHLVKGRKDEGSTGVYVAAYDASGAAIANLEAFRAGLGEFVYYKLYKDHTKYPWEVRGIK
jgi:pimeloyl-ACP methyl ester carboxylesterase